MDLQIDHETRAGGGRYVLRIDGAVVGELDHRDGERTRDFVHTGIRPTHEGRGLAAHLVRRGLDDARADGVRVIPSCWYVARYLDRHPADQDLLAP